MIIAMSCTKDWYRYLIVDLYSLLKCTKNIKKIYLLIETDNIKEVPYLEDLAQNFNIEIKTININPFMQNNLKIECPNLNTIYSDFSFVRLMLVDVVKEDKVLYIDTDAIVKKDISNVWKYDISDYYVAGIRDYGILGEGIIEKYNITGKYINSGFVVFNLKKIRKDKIKEKWFNIINKKKLDYPDQDALNIVCQHKELYLPSMYNFSEYAGEYTTLKVQNSDLIKVYHFAGPKEFWVADRFYSEEWYDEYEKFYDDFVKRTQDLIIAMCCKKNWYNHLVVSLYSLFTTTKNIKKVYLFAETENIKEIPYLQEIKEKFKINIKLINFNKEIKEKLNKMGLKLNKIVIDFKLGKFLMPDYIKEKKIVYIDTDIIIKKDISGILKYDIKNSYIAGVKDYGIYERKKFMKKYIKGKYIQAGLSVWNLAKMRKDNIHNKCFELINEMDLPYPDQDALNIICKDAITYLPSMYNICDNVTLEVLNNKLAKAYHFAGEKEDWVVDCYYAEEWYEIEEEFYNEFLKK